MFVLGGDGVDLLGDVWFFDFDVEWGCWWDCLEGFVECGDVLVGVVDGEWGELCEWGVCCGVCVG